MTDPTAFELGDARPATVTRAAVVGMGTMGSRIAQAVAMAGVPVVVVEEDAAVLTRGSQRIRASLEKRVAQGRLDCAARDQMLASLTATADLTAVGGADLVIEAVFEDLDVKRRVLAQVESVCRREAVVATNTSTINLDRLAERLERPDRLVGMHFFNPAHVIPLVEIIRRDATPPEPLATVLGFTRRIGKRPVLLRNREGFLVNRIFIPYLKEAFLLLEDGADPVEVDAAMVEFGFPMGTLAVADLAGIDIIVNAAGVMEHVFAHHGPTSAIAIRLVESGQLGQKSGAGVYRYEPGDTTPHPSGLAQQVIAGVQQGFGRKPQGLGRQEIVRRLVYRMVAEAFRVIEERVAASESDVDVATVLGVGFPDSRGGVMNFARDLGLDAVRAELQVLSARCGPRYELRE